MENEVHQRAQKKVRSSDEEKEKMGHRKHKSFKYRRTFRTYLLYLIFISISCFFLAYQLLHSSYKVSPIDEIGYSLGLHSNVYAVIIDAGSTGSRVLGLSFYKSGFDGSLKLQNDLFVQNKPGLSSYAENPEKAAKKIAELLEEAKNFIPKEAWSNTPVALRATAGLRLLPSDKAQNLLKEVQKVIDDSPFMSDKDSVSIMDGKDEGLFSWFTVNFLLDHLKSDTSQTVATLDLGGGSVQITFIPQQSERIIKEAPGHLYRVSIMNKKVETYSYSYLGLGLMAARRRVFLNENPEAATNIISSCVNPVVIDKQWYYGGTKFSVSGNNKADVKVNAEKCYQIIKSIVEEGNVDKPPEVFEHKIIAFSYFFDRAAESGLIDAYTGGTITVKEFQQGANYTCHNANVDQPFMCLDLTFISSLFLHGFGLNPDTPITLMDTIDGHEISWALGAAYQILEDKLSA